jgi:hypothetical protein
MVGEVEAAGGDATAGAGGASVAGATCTVGAIFGMVAGGAESFAAVGALGPEAATSNESGQLGMACAGVSGSSSSEGGGHAGIARSVGGSGGQISVSTGGAGEDSEAGGQVDFIASPATALGGSVKGAWATGSIAGGTIDGGAVESVSGSGSTVVSAGSAAVVSAASATGSGSAVTESTTSSPGEVGTVSAQAGAAFLPSPLAVVSVFDQSGSPFLWAGAAGDVCAQTGVVSRVGTACTGSSVLLSGGVESCDSVGSGSKSQSV